MEPMDKCKEYRELIPEFVLDELDAVEMDRLDAHIGACHRCRHELVLMRGLTENLAAVEEADPGPGFARQVMSRIHSETWLERLSRLISTILDSRPLRVAVPALALGALLLLVIPPRAIRAPSGDGAGPELAARPSMGLYWTGGSIVVNNRSHPEAESGRLTLEKGDSVRTTASTRLTMAYPEGSTVDLDENTRLLVKTDGVFLSDGKIAASIEGLEPESFRVETKNAVITHLGTQFTVEAGDGRTHVEVASGRVGVTTDRVNDKVLFPGQFATVVGGGELEYGSLQRPVAGVNASLAPENVDVRFLY